MGWGVRVRRRWLVTLPHGALLRHVEEERGGWRQQRQQGQGAPRLGCHRRRRGANTGALRVVR